MSAKPFVPDDFDPPRELELPEFHLVPLGAQHNESDYAAVSRWLVERTIYADRTDSVTR